MTSRRLRIEVLTKAQDPGILPPEATGLEITIQAARLSVAADIESTLHAVILGADGKRPEDHLLLAGLFPGHVVS